MTRAPEELAVAVLLALVVIVACTRLVGWVFVRMRQPPVVGELLTGILMGPTVLGLISDDATSSLFPADTRPFLGIIGNLGLIIFMFLVGLELDLRVLRARRRMAARISLASVGLPFVLGIGLALWLHGGRDSVGLLPFALFIGTAVSVTAFPVLARIISDSGLRRTELGTLVLACAAFEDVIAWTLLGCALAAAAADGVWDLPGTFVGTLAFAATAVMIGRPLLRRLLERGAIGHGGLVAVAVCGAAACACVTSELGTHLVFGAFIFGVVFPRDPAVRSALESGLMPLATSVLLPVFFVLPGLQLDLWESGAAGIVQLAVILLVACVGKLVGATGAALQAGLPGREAAAIGVLINTRGLMEIVVLNVGLSAAVIDRHLYGLFVVMAIVTTLMAGPVLRTLYRGGDVPAHLGRRVRSRRATPDVSNPLPVRSR
jgi:Kef-type K+ transport system membrane component KefB